MGIFDALTTAVAGLQAQSFALQNISGNIANSQTTGYKETDTELSGSGRSGRAEPADDKRRDRQLGRNQHRAGHHQLARRCRPTWRSTVTAGSWSRNRPDSTDNQPTFSGVTDFTRAGDFQLNVNGNLVNSAGYYLMGIPVNATTGNPEGSVPQVLQFDNNFIPAQATTSITYQANLPSTPTSGMIDPSDFANNPIAGAEIIGTGATLNAGCGRGRHRHRGQSYGRDHAFVARHCRRR